MCHIRYKCNTISIVIRKVCMLLAFPHFFFLLLSNYVSETIIPIVFFGWKYFFSSESWKKTRNTKAFIHSFWQLHSIFLEWKEEKQTKANWFWLMSYDNKKKRWEFHIWHLIILAPCIYALLFLSFSLLGVYLCKIYSTTYYIYCVVEYF